jgi:hypothetical protein
LRGIFESIATAYVHVGPMGSATQARYPGFRPDGRHIV